MPFRNRSASSAACDVRLPFARQPAHCLIVDLTSSFKHDTLLEICRAVSNFFSVVCSMRSGPNRIPYFCVLAMTPYTEVLFAAQRLEKSSYSRIEAALNQMLEFLSDGNVQKSSKVDVKALEYVVRDATSQFQRIKGNATSSTKLEITILSCHKMEQVSKALTIALSKSNVTDIGRVNGICLVQHSSVDDETTVADQIDETEDVPASLTDLTGILDVFCVDCNSLSVESVMRNWLNDRGMDREHLHLQFNMPGSETPLVVKCDMRERLINLSELPYRQSYEISFDGSDISQQGYKSASKPTYSVPIVVLRIIKRVQASSICESIVFGNPTLLSSSNCWQMEWDELETNQNYFNALCQSLIHNKEAMICENTTPRVDSRRGVGQDKRPFGLFSIMPSENFDSLLLKAISSQELLLAPQVSLPNQWDVVTKEAMEKVNAALSFVETEENFNPLVIKSGLVAALKLSLKDSGGPLNRKQQVTQKPAYGKSGVALQLQNAKPATGKATRFVAPRQNDANQSLKETIFENDQRNIPTITLGSKLESKNVTFSDFPDY